MRHLLTFVSAAALAALTAPAVAQTPSSARPTPEARARVYASTSTSDDETRPVIGVSTTSSGERDTLGLLVVSVTPGGPADKAGIEEGDRLAAVNGVNLRLASADAGENDMNGLTTRRLSREIAKLKAGADVELRVWSGGAFKTVKVKTIAADELPNRSMRLTRADAESRGVLGMTLGGGGSRRDTLGLLVARVETDGPAEKAGIVEGDRIAAVNGSDLRVSREDAGDGWVMSAKNSRFTRALRDLKPGEKVTLKLYSAGQSRTVDVTAAKSADVYKQRMGNIYIGDMGNGYFGGAIAPLPAIAPMPPMAPMPAPRVRIYRGNDASSFDGDASFNFNVDTNEIRALGEQLRGEVQRALENVRPQLERAREMVVRRGMTTI
jgi:serine protease Do